MRALNVTGRMQRATSDVGWCLCRSTNCSPAPALASTQRFVDNMAAKLCKYDQYSKHMVFYFCYQVVDANCIALTMVVLLVTAPVLS